MDGGGEVGSWRALRAIRCRGRRTGGRPGSGPPLRAGGGARDRRSCMLLHLRYSRFPRPEVQGRRESKVAESPRLPVPEVQGCAAPRSGGPSRPRGAGAGRGPDPTVYTLLYWGGWPVLYCQYTVLYSQYTVEYSVLAVQSRVHCTLASLPALSRHGFPCKHAPPEREPARVRMHSPPSRRRRRGGGGGGGLAWVPE